MNACAKVALVARNEGRLLQVAEEIARSGSIAMPLRCDGADATDARGAVNKCLAVFGSLDMLVNAAGVTIPAKVETARLEDLQEMMDINYFGVVHMVQAALPHMKAQEFGRIVNMGSGRRAPRRIYLGGILRG